MIASSCICLLKAGFDGQQEYMLSSVIYATKKFGLSSSSGISDVPYAYIRFGRIRAFKLEVDDEVEDDDEEEVESIGQ